jgi:diacylglycerol kinase family enzyme
LNSKTNHSNGTGGEMPLVIVNPHSAGGKTGESWAALASDLRAHFGPYKVAFTKASGDGITLAQNAAESGRKFIIACGGDGTINEVANGILLSGKDAELGVLPSGTGGDFRRSIEMPDEPREAARALKTGKTRTIDVGKVTFQTADGNTDSRYFLNISSFGLAGLHHSPHQKRQPARMAADRRRSRPGRLRSFQLAGSYRPEHKERSACVSTAAKSGR